VKTSLTLAAIAGALLFATGAHGEQAALADHQSNPHVFDWLTGHSLTLSKTLTGAGGSQGASFSYSKTDSQAAQLSTQFALQWTAYRPHAIFFFNTSVAGSVNDPDTKQTSFLDFRARVGYHYEGQTLSFDLYSGALLEDSSDFRVKNLILETELVPTYSVFHFYQKVPFFSDIVQGASVELMPTFVFQVGRNVAGLAYSPEADATRLRVMPRIGVALHFTCWARALHFQDISISADNQYVYLPLENTRSYNHLDTSLDVKVTKNVSLGISWQTGQLAPYYVRSSMFKIQLGVGFGDRFSDETQPTASDGGASTKPECS